MATFHRGQLLVGLRHSYHLLEPAHRRTNNVWIASLENGQSSMLVILYALIDLPGPTDLPQPHGKGSDKDCWPSAITE
jgi:hypothetical protein